MKEFGFYLKRKRKKKKAASLWGPHCTLHVHPVLLSGRLGWQHRAAFPQGAVCWALHAGRARRALYCQSSDFRNAGPDPPPAPLSWRPALEEHARVFCQLRDITRQTQTLRRPLLSPQPPPGAAHRRDPRRPLPAPRGPLHNAARRRHGAAPPAEEGPGGQRGTGGTAPAAGGAGGSPPTLTHTHTYTRTHALCNAAPGEPRDPAGSSRLPGWGGRGGARGGLGA